MLVPAQGREKDEGGVRGTPRGNTIGRWTSALLITLSIFPGKGHPDQSTPTSRRIHPLEFGVLRTRTLCCVSPSMDRGSMDRVSLNTAETVLHGDNWEQDRAPVCSWRPRSWPRKAKDNQNQK